MKKKMKRLIPMLLLLFTLVGVLLPSVEAKAGAKLDAKTIYCFVSHEWGDIALNLTDGAELKKVKISNKKVLSFNMERRSLHTLAPGKSTITYYVSDNGKTKVLKQNVVVVSGYPFKSFKVNGKDVTSSVNSTRRVVDLKKGRYKITWKLSPGYKLVSARGERFIKKLKNGGVITFDRDDLLSNFDTLHFCVKDKKGHIFREYVFRVNGYK